MSDAERGKAGVVRHRSIHQVHYNLRRRDDTMARPLRPEVQAYARQVAGHKDNDDQHYNGLLQCSNGRIMKPILKESQRREVDFYSRVFSSDEPQLQELRRCVPKYFGCTKYSYGGREHDYIILEDLSERMLEPCIMDVKIGKRTWDPNATEEKMMNEQRKYAQCKQEFGFCIPGFQVYRVATGKLHKYNKDYGKKLHGRMVREAVRSYLNGVGASVCRALVLQLLSQLWRVQRWAREQTQLRLYAASLLLIYDAARLRAVTEHSSNGSPRVASPARRKSVPTIPLAIPPGSPPTGSFSGQLAATGPIYSRVSPVPLSPLSPSIPPPPPINSPWADALDKLNHNHSFDHNYEEKLSKIKMNYKATLDQLSYESPTPNPWGTVKIIDFAHAFFNDDDERALDDNFREGVDNFVAIFESFLRETDDQVI